VPNLAISDKGATAKLKETHYEEFVRVYKKMLGVSPLKIVQDVINTLRDMTGYEPSTLDDTPYQEAAVIIFNSRLRSMGYKGPNLAYKTIYEGDPNILNEYRSVMNVLHHTYRFSKNRMIFRFEEALTAKLLHTDLTKVDSSFLTSPFESIYIDLPYNEELFIPNHLTGLHKVKGIYVSYGHDIDVKGVNLPLEGGPDRDGIHPALKFDGVPANKVIRILAVAGPNANSDNALDDATFYMTFFLAPGDVFPQVKAAADRYTQMDGGEDQKQYMHKLFSFVLNALMYITNPSADLVRTHAKFKKAVKGKVPVIDGLSHIDVVTVGSSVHITHDFRQAYRNGTLKTFTISSPHWVVRGHWRNQAHGPERSLRRMTWIEPYSKGKGVVEEVVGRDYHVS